MSERSERSERIEPRVAQALNQALHRAFDRFGDLFLLGEDVLDPYGGAFKITAGLSTRYPGRVLTTPLSEGGIVGVANGLAMCGHRVIVEVMFCDFAGLAFDQVLNLTAKSVAMYGRRYPMPVLLRCPSGGRRGYGPTHSQSLLKHFIGIPDLALYELSPFHDVDASLDAVLARSEPGILFEDKVTYTERMFPGAPGDLAFERQQSADGNWAELRRPRPPDGPLAVIIAPGGVGRRALAAATELAGDGLDARVLVPFQLYPVALEPVLDLLTSAAVVVVAEESTVGGTWGNEVAARVHETAWRRLAGPVRSVSSAGSVIPAAPHLEREMLVSSAAIVAAVRAGLDQPLETGPKPAQIFINENRVQKFAADRAPFPEANAAQTNPVTVPKLNNNDDEYLLTAWLADDGALVTAGQPIADLETSKATQELPAEAAGVLRQLIPAGAQCRPGEVIAHLVNGHGGAVSGLSPAEPSQPAVRSEPDDRAEAFRLPAAQRHVARVVAESHRTIPAAFAVARVAVGRLVAGLTELAAATGAEIGLAEAFIKAVGTLHGDHPLVFAALEPDWTIRAAPTADIAVTVDLGTGLFMPVLRDVASMSLEDVADQLTEYRMAALRGRLTERDLAGAALAVSLTMEDGIVLVQPIVPPGLAAIVSLAAPDHAVAEIGLAHDHRLVNGREAAAFLSALKRTLEQPDWIESQAAPANGRRSHD